MNIYLETLRYYADWIGIPVVRLEQATEKVIYVENPDRANTPAGYSNPVDIYIFASEKAVFVSYSGKSKQIVENMQANFKCYNDINILSEDIFGERAVRKIKYYLDEPPKALSFTAARALTYGDFPQFRISLKTIILNVQKPIGCMIISKNLWIVTLFSECFPTDVW